MKAVFKYSTFNKGHDEVKPLYNQKTQDFTKKLFMRNGKVKIGEMYKSYKLNSGHNSRRTETTRHLFPYISYYFDIIT